jgi:chemotaxis protein MotB
MSAGQSKRKLLAPKGVPAWMVTFADLMALLVVFFVLIVSFSVQDERKMQIVAGSLRIAFGVQRDFMARGVIELDGRPELRRLLLRPSENEVIAMPIPQVSPPQEVQDEDAEDAEQDWDPNDPLAEAPVVRTTDAEVLSNVGDARSIHDLARISDPDPTTATQAQPRQSDYDWGMDYRAALQAALEKRLVESMESRVDDLVRRDPALADAARHLQIDRTEAGVRVQLVDQPDAPMFTLGSAEPNDQARRLMRAVAGMLRELPNRIEIVGHTDALPYRGARDYDNWDLSTDRAQATRRALLAEGVPPARIARVVGKGDAEHLIPQDPYDARNRRIGILLLRGEPAREARLGDLPARRP